MRNETLDEKLCICTPRFCVCIHKQICVAEHIAKVIFTTRALH